MNRQHCARIFSFFAAVSVVFTGAGHANEADDKEKAEYYMRQKNYQPGAGYEREPEYTFEGVIKALPADRHLGVWTVDDRQIMVFPGTMIKEAQGKAAVGVKVKVKGILRDLNFMAAEIEIKSGDK
jgi:hypothetical protein